MGDDKREFAEWIDTENLAEVVMNGLEVSGCKPNLANAQKVWLDFLGTDLNEDIHYSIEALNEKGELERR
jgi:hypothetical protein